VKGWAIRSFPSSGFQEADMKGSDPEKHSTDAPRGIRKLLKDALTPTGIFTIVPGLANLGSTWQAILHAWHLHAVVTEAFYITVGLAGAAYMAWQFANAGHRSN
jgi:hypothetical protein